MPVLSLGSISLGGLGLGRQTIATIFAIVFGVGHIYLGETRRGIAILVIGIGLVLIAYPGSQNISAINLQAITTAAIVNVGLIGVGLGSIGFWIWQILDARKIAAKQQAIEV